MYVCMYMYFCMRMACKYFCPVLTFFCPYMCPLYVEEEEGLFRANAVNEEDQEEEEEG